MTLRHPFVFSAGLMSTAGLVLAACAPSAPGAQEDVEGTTTLVVAPSSEMSAAWAQFAVAQEQGFFADNGISVELQWPGGSSDVLQQMATGRVQIGAPTPEAVLAAEAKGQDVEMIYNWTRAPVQWLAVDKGSAITSFKDLEGKKVGVANLASGAKLLCEAAVRDAGGDPSKIDFVATGTGVAANDALKQGRVDALMLWDTEYTKMEQAGSQLQYLKSEAYGDLFSTTFAAQAEWVRSNPELVKGFGKAWAEATVWATENPEAAVEMMWKRYPQTKISDDPKLLDKHVELFEGRNVSAMTGDPIESKTLGQYPPKSIDTWLDFARQAKITSSPLKADALYTNDFVEAYNDFDEQAVKKSASEYTSDE